MGDLHFWRLCCNVFLRKTLTITSAGAQAVAYIKGVLSVYDLGCRWMFTCGQQAYADYAQISNNNVERRRIQDAAVLYGRSCRRVRDRFEASTNAHPSRSNPDTQILYATANSYTIPLISQALNCHLNVGLALKSRVDPESVRPITEICGGGGGGGC